MQHGLVSKQESRQSAARWWTAFNDPLLSNLIDKALADNLDLKQAQARLREARARRRGSEAGFFPTVEAAASVNSTSSSKAAGTGKRSELYNASFDARWELDIFGGVRREVEAKQADLAASLEEYNSTIVSLAAEVASNYVEMRVREKQLAVAEENLKAQSETHALTAWRFEAGQGSALDVEQAKYNLENTRAQLADFKSALAASRNRIAILAGEYPGRIAELLSEPQEIPLLPVKVAVGVPADLLRRRPDLRQAERQLAAQTARVGVATAELYPKLTLVGSIGLEALTGSNLFTSDAESHRTVAALGLPIFNAGALRANIEVQSALQEQALLHYEAILQEAVEEVENAIAAFVQEQQRLASLAEAAAAAENAVELARSNFAAGLSDFREVLEAQRSLFSFQSQLADSRGKVASNLIRLYKALGGGWELIGDQ